MKIGQKIKYNGTEVKYDNFEWLKKGCIGKVVKYSPEIKGTGRILDYYDDGEPIIDTGIREYYTADFGKSGKRCFEKEDIGKTILLL